MNRIATLQQAHPFLDEEDARLLLVSSYMAAHQDLKHLPATQDKADEVQRLIELSVQAFTSTSADQIKNALSIIHEHVLD